MDTFSSPGDWTKIYRHCWAVLALLSTYHISAQPVEKLSVELLLLLKEKLNKWEGKSSAESHLRFFSWRNASAGIAHPRVAQRDYSKQTV
jgi:hypothetical protein